MLEGIRILYVNYYSMWFPKIALILAGIPFIIFGLIGVVETIKIKEIGIIFAAGILILMGVAIICGSFTIKPCYSYTVEIDDSVSYTELTDTYGDDRITHSGGNIYIINVYEETK